MILTRTRTTVVVIGLPLVLVLGFFAASNILAPSSREATLRRALRERPFRATRLRLSVDVPYRPAMPITRGPATRGDRDRTGREGWTFLEIAADAQDTNDDAESAETLHVRGLALLVAGEALSSGGILRRALQRGEITHVPVERIAALWNDLAAAHFQCAEEGDTRKYVFALDAAERSWALQRTAASAWTRAMLLEQLNLRNYASRAWETYFELEGDSAWAEEARTRRSTDARNDATSSFTDAVRGTLVAACARGDVEAARHIVRAHPKEARALGEDEFLAAWAAAAGTGLNVEAQRLETIRSLGLAFESGTGDVLLADVAAAIAEATRDPDRRDTTIAAIRLFGEGRDAYNNRRIALAEQRLARAEEGLRAAGNPLALLANVYRAAMVHASNRYADILKTIDPSAPPERYFALRGIRGWVMGLAHVQTGRPGASVDAYELSLEGFRNAGEHENVATVLHLRAETLDYMTATDEAWSDRMAGVQMFRGRDVSARPLVWMSVAMAAVRDELEYAADVILAEIAADAQRRGDSMWLTEAGMWRALARSRMGQPLTSAALEQIHGALDRIEDPGIRARSEANLHLVTSEITFRTTAMPDLDKALQFYRSNDDQFNAMTALAQTAHARAATADFRSADANLVTALTELTRQARDVQDPFMRTLFAERAKALLLMASDVQLMRGRPEAALWFSDRPRLVTLETFHAAWAEPGRDVLDAEAQGQRLVDSVPAGVTFVHQDLRDETLRTWVLRDGQTQFVAKPVMAAALQAEIDEFLFALRSSDHAALQTQSRRLYDTLLGPLREHLTDDSLLVYAPASILRRVPVGALHDGSRFLVERRRVATARALASVAWGGFTSKAAGQNVLVALPDSAPGAPSLPGARAEIAALAYIYDGQSTTLTGAAATPESFMAMAAQFDVIHISGHGRVDRRPLQNAIEFGSRRLRAYDVLGLQLHRRPVVVLAGCRTDDETVGRATLSLAGAFVAAGASAVVGSLWDVDDQSTARLMAEFHQHLRRGIVPEQALRLTQKSAILRRDAISAWAAFQMQM